MTVIEPSCSVRVTRRVWCSQVTRRPSRSRVLPLEKLDGARKTLTCAAFLVQAPHSVVRDVAPDQASHIGEVGRSLGPSHPRMKPFQPNNWDRVLAELRVKHFKRVVHRHVHPDYLFSRGGSRASTVGSGACSTKMSVTRSQRVMALYSPTTLRYKLAVPSLAVQRLRPKRWDRPS